MSDKIHYTIKSIGKSFTFKEWCEWNNKKREQGIFGSVVVHKHNEYEWNDNDVCITPSLIVIDDWTNVRVGSPSEGEWYYGFSSISASSPCSIWGKPFATKEEAEDAGLQTLVKHIESKIEWYRVSEDYRADERRAIASLDLVKQVIGKRKFKQLTLF